MNQPPDRSQFWHLLVIFLVVTLTFSCASLPPAQSIRDFREVTGQWYGRICTHDIGCSPIAVIYMEDGSGESIVPNGSVHFPYSDNVRCPLERKLIDGKIQVINTVTGDTGIATIHEIEGKRLMFYKSDDGTTTGKYKPITK